LSADWISPDPPAERHPAGFNILWAGRLEHRKALSLALQALGCVKSTSVRLSVVGTGPLRSELEALTRDLGLTERVTYLGSVPYADMQTVFQTSDAFLFTSLRDSSGTVVLEAMAKGLPIITLDHQGVGTFVPKEAGIKVPVTNPRETIKGVSDAIEKLAGSPAILRNMQLAGWRCAGEQTWDQRADKMSKVYEEVVYQRRHPEMSKEAVSSVRVEP
jgi:glycosyltransferase involved in cell wall biosynthesis